MKIAMISYNGFVDGESNGWKTQGETSLLLIQKGDGHRNMDGTVWGAPNSGDRRESSHLCQSVIGDLWSELVEVLPSLDKVVFYVGSHGAERIIQLAAEHGLSPDRAMFVRCDCNLDKKTEIIRSCGFSSSPVRDCACGGHDEMNRLYHAFLNGDYTSLTPE